MSKNKKGRNGGDRATPKTSDNRNLTGFGPLLEQTRHSRVSLAVVLALSAPAIAAALAVLWAVAL